MSLRPNLLFICTDQQSANMLSCAGNPWLKTPAMDSLAARGTRFERAYCANPMCVPSRFSLFTGRRPSLINCIGGSGKVDKGPLYPLSESIRLSSLGWLLQEAGYHTYYGGKVHLPHKLSPEDIGFANIESDQRDQLAQTAAQFLQAPPAEPFCLVVSLINPHDICYHALRDFAESDFEKLLVRKGETEIAELDRALAKPEGADEETFFRDHCPPLPANHLPQADEPEALRLMLERTAFRRKARAHWTERDWRRHRWAFARLTERVDGQIGIVLDALRRSDREQNTLVILTSDHGDMDASRQLEHKDVPYEECCRIPFIAAGPGVRQAHVDTETLVSNGLDLLPTLCDYANARAPSDLEGRSLRPAFEGREASDPRHAIPIECAVGQLMVSRRAKYIRYYEGEPREQLLALDTDDPESRNLIADPAYGAELASLKIRYINTYLET